MIIDSPPVGLVADALSLAGYADAVLVAARMNKTTTDEAREARALLERAGARPIGVVANGVKPSRGYYRYGTYSAAEPSKVPA